MNSTIDASDFAQLADFWKRAPEITKEELLIAVTDSDVLLQGELMQALPSGAGGAAGLRGSIFHEEQVLADNVLGMTSTDKQYAPFIELGTRPHLPPITPLIDWVEAKLGLHGAEAKSAAFAISRKIGKHGTRPNPVWRTVWQAQQTAIRRKFDEAMQRIASRLAGGAA
ncbi:MAG: hypothetical protein ABIQ70_13040 [Dokdonella sp.]